MPTCTIAYRHAIFHVCTHTHTCTCILSIAAVVAPVAGLVPAAGQVAGQVGGTAGQVVGQAVGTAGGVAGQASNTVGGATNLVWNTVPDRPCFKSVAQFVLSQNVPREVKAAADVNACLDLCANVRVTPHTHIDECICRQHQHVNQSNGCQVQ